ncbi:multiubiquitin domain-containing protein [Rhizobium leguminosarum]|uniref:multiubiquitin domain-containing protein n=1 Tax=Rhizobium leguminosarum TaxID=384 RepID=UPI00293DD8D8|nr:multiubiquitin domain-containing protein [Rhizobium leguminosarum]MDV4160578.1 multiubiquitin domain-containing protein [Rhizobium leguminosarum]MDV4170307.1 multiubiquitin domain-containing protein [Rhizobium leguminosarum]
MTIEHHKPPRDKNTTVEIAGLDLNFHAFQLDTKTPTGGKIAKVFGFNPDQSAYVMQWRDDGDLEDLRVQEEADLDNGTKFIVAKADSTNRIRIEGEGFDWPSDTITGAVVRKLGGISADRGIYLERTDEADRLIEDSDVVKIKTAGVEQFQSRKPEVWELNVQGKKITSLTPVISVVEALTRTGFDPEAWIIILKVAGQPKRQLSVGDEIDLRAPGIEKVRLTAKDVNNGEAHAAPPRDFALLDVDESYLDGLRLRWETTASDGNRWLIIRDYPVPDGYTARITTLALMVPATYPQAEIDMFYAHPPLQRSTGAAIPATEATQVIGRLPFQRWSRHRGAVAPWNPQRDNVVTHLALVESALLQEVGE